MAELDLNTQAFTDEARELLAELEEALLELEEQPDDHDLIDRVFRAMHTIKGSGAMFGFDDIASFTHDVENVFDLVRDGKLKITTDLLNLTLASRDHISYLLDCSMTRREVDFGKGEELTRKIRAFLPEAKPEARKPGTGMESVEGGEANLVTFRVRFKPFPEFFAYGANPLGLLEELREFGNAHSFVHLEDLPDLEMLDPESCHVWWDLLLTTGRSEDAIRDIFMFVEDDCDLLIQTIDSMGILETDRQYKRLGEILVERGDITPKDLQDVLSKQRPLIKPLGEALAESGKVSAASVESALEEQMAIRDIRKDKSAAQASETASSIRVAADKLDHLVDLVGELVIVQAQISEIAGQSLDPKLQSLSENLEFLSDELRDSTLDIRMLPIGTTFSKFRRLVRDLSADLGKEIELKTSGAETELDKTVIERLGDPLVHLLRNSIDHGIELPSVRTSQNKPPKGVISLEAEHAAGEVIIRITDDGKGLDRNVILEKAVSRGLVQADAEMSDKEVFHLIFLPGFSTAETVSSVSGRGVGMDVVKRGIESLRGVIDLDSSPGLGTIITIRLPLTLAIIDGLQVMVNGDCFVIPLSCVEECLEYVRERDGERGKRKLINLRGEIVPFIRLRDWFEDRTGAPAIEQVVVTHTHLGRIGVVVDTVIGEHQTVIKSLGRVYSNLQWISGATIKGDGTMALILDITQLVHTATEGGFLD